MAVNAVLSTQIATGCAAFSWILMEFCVKRQPTVLGMINGSLAGLISITPAAGYVDATGAFLIGLFSGPVCYYGISVKKMFGFDDGLDAFGLHGIAVCTCFCMISYVCVCKYVRLYAYTLFLYQNIA
jgi:Amt family ammonium transporter